MHKFQNLNDCFNTPFGALLKSKTSFTPEVRNVVSLKIGEYLVNNLIKPTPKQYADMLKQLIEIFPHESHVQDLYYKKNQSNKPSGTLYIKYAKVARNNRSVLRILNNEKEVSDNFENDNNCEEINYPNANLSGSLNWLQLNTYITPENFDDFKEHWKYTSSERIPKLINLEKWPQFKLNTGHELVNIDFKNYYRNDKDLNHDDLILFIRILLPKMESFIKSPVYRVKCQDIFKIKNKGKNYLVFNIVYSSPCTWLFIQFHAIPSFQFHFSVFRKHFGTTVICILLRKFIMLFSMLVAFHNSISKYWSNN